MEWEIANVKAVLLGMRMRLPFSLAQKAVKRVLACPDFVLSWRKLAFVCSTLISRQIAISIPIYSIIFVLKLAAKQLGIVRNNVRSSLVPITIFYKNHATNCQVTQRKKRIIVRCTVANHGWMRERGAHAVVRWIT